MAHDLWVEVDLAALRHNLRQVSKLVGDGVKTMAVVKANGYGHGCVEPARAFIDAGADALAVTRIDEARVIRNAGIDTPILLFAPVQPEDLEDALQADLDLTVTAPDPLGAISKAARKLGKTARIHIKVDTGMGRLGIIPAKAQSILQEIPGIGSMQAAGIYTHFATAGERNLDSARRQHQSFLGLLERLDAAGVSRGLAHAANSAAVIRMPESHFDMVRPGTILYGQYPSRCVPRSLDLKPTWRLKARICQINELPKGRAVGYGGEFVTRRPTRTAVLPIGWADGFTLVPEGPIYRQSVLRFAARKMGRRLFVTIRGQRTPVLGRVAMQMTVVDVTDVAGAHVGDEVEVPALRIPTNPLIPRIYIDPESRAGAK